MSLEARSERLELGGFDLESCGSAMAAEAREPLAACAKPFEQVETGDAAARAFAAPFRIERDQDRGPAVALGHPRGADADDPGVPPLAPQDDRGPRLPVGLVLREQPICV